MDKSEKFFLICPVLSVFVQVAERVSACGYLRRCSIKSLEKIQVVGRIIRTVAPGKSLVELAGSQQNFVARLFCFQDELILLVFHHKSLHFFIFLIPCDSDVG